VRPRINAIGAISMMPRSRCQSTLNIEHVVQRVIEGFKYGSIFPQCSRQEAALPLLPAA
jgi:hypothetical protein